MHVNVMQAHVVVAYLVLTAEETSTSALATTILNFERVLKLDMDMNTWRFQT